MESEQNKYSRNGRNLKKPPPFLTKLKYALCYLWVMCQTPQEDIRPLENISTTTLGKGLSPLYHNISSALCSAWHLVGTQVYGINEPC